MAGQGGERKPNGRHAGQDEAAVQTGPSSIRSTPHAALAGIINRPSKIKRNQRARKNRTGPSGLENWKMVVGPVAPEDVNGLQLVRFVEVSSE